MIINGVLVDDTFSEAFAMRATRIIITAINYKWAMHAAASMTGFATSVIGCKVEAGIERMMGNHETPVRPLAYRPGLLQVLRHGGNRVADVFGQGLQRKQQQ